MQPSPHQHGEAGARLRQCELLPQCAPLPPPAIRTKPFLTQREGNATGGLDEGSERNFRLFACHSP
jgi:hypothetical protein